MDTTMKRRKPAPKPKPVDRPHIEIAERDIENPMWSRAHDGEKTNPRLIRAQVNTLESPISYLASKGALFPAQVAAADRLRALFERMGASGARAIDWRREAVDGGRIPEPVGIMQIDAGLILKTARQAVVAEHGEYGWRILQYVCADGRHIREMAATRREQDTLTDNLRRYLDCLSVHWGFSTKAKRNASETV